MPRGLNTGGTIAKRPARQETVKAKRLFLEALRKGYTVKAACNRVGRHENTYHYWMNKDKEFRFQVERFRAERDGVVIEDNRVNIPDFPEFSEKYLGQPLYWHQLQWVDLLEGRQPRDLHPSQVYEPGGGSYIIVNTPPGHGKSTTLTMNYVTYRVLKDPNIKILIVSKTMSQAKKFLYGIKVRLTSPAYEELQRDFAPSGGFKDTADTWKQDMIYLGDAAKGIMSEHSDRGAKDPTIQAIGIGGQIYGNRVDLIIMDDCVDLSNAHAYEEHVEWIQQEVITRPDPCDYILLVGTRVAPKDIYSEIRNPERYLDDESGWTYLSQPAILEAYEDPEQWKTLWPTARVPWKGSSDKPDANGEYPHWNGHYLYKRRKQVSPSTWARAYMQQDVSEDSVFQVEDVKACVDPFRGPGKLLSKTNRIQEMQGLRVIAGFDPAPSGDTAIVVVAVDPIDGQRWVLDVRIKTAPSPQWVNQTIKDMTLELGIQEWRVENAMFGGFIASDEELYQWLTLHGVIMLKHNTNQNKWDSEFGVAAMTNLFKTKKINLPNATGGGTKMLVEQLVTWIPREYGKRQTTKTDAVMALWFAEFRAQEIVRSYSGTRPHHIHNRYLSARHKQMQGVIALV